ncbi:MAG: Rpn family recombination-promoting nuclease/putative transposase [Lachnospiraceae bacterium]|nr:Rpn family recombination-promoting nuclease/putative transposase [Lachnospiraceae bacterium]
MAQEFTRTKFQDLNLSNAYLFAAALEDPEVCRITLQLLLDQEVSSVSVNTEHSLLYNSDCRSIRLDVYAKDETGTSFNLEMQGENERNLPKRSRYHQAEMDVLSLNPGEDFSELQPNYVIFICRFDPFGKGLYRYTYRNKCEETGEDLQDGTVKIFFNTQGKNEADISQELLHFLQYIEDSSDICVAQQEDAVRKIHNRVQTIKRDRTWESRFMRFEELLQKERRKGLEEGREEGREQVAAQMQKLIGCMTAAGETELLPRLADAEFFDEMLKKYVLNESVK